MTTNSPAPAPKDPISDAISLLNADAASIRHSHTPPCDRDDWSSEPNAKVHYDHVLVIVAVLSKQRAPVADERPLPIEFTAGGVGYVSIEKARAAVEAARQASAPVAGRR